MSIGVAVVILIEALIALAVILGFIFFDTPLRAWEDQRIRKRKVRKCRKLAEDGIWAEVRYERGA